MHDREMMARTARIALLLLAACGGHAKGHPDELVGSTCVSDRDCVERCLPDSGDFPGGFCTIACASDRDCPSDSLCVNEKGGICLFECAVVTCTRLGAGWGCGHDNDVGGGEVEVCVGL